MISTFSMVFAVPGWSGMVLVLLACSGAAGQDSFGAARGGGLVGRMPQTAKELAMQRAKLDEEVWSPEVLAQGYERTFTALWDNLIRPGNEFEVFRQQQFEKLLIGTDFESTPLDWEIEALRPTGPAKTIEHQDWAGWLRGLQDAGIEVVETEWHHQRFDPPTKDRPANSTVSFVIHATGDEGNHRYIVRGSLEVTWASGPTATNNAIPATVDATDVTILSRRGKPGFKEQRIEVFSLDPSGRRKPSTVHPVMLHDLNADGLPEVVVADFNLVYWNRGDWKFEHGELCAHRPLHPNAAAFADFTGDGVTDFFVAVKNGFPHLYVGEPGGRFPHEPQVSKVSDTILRLPEGCAVADIDADGDLDVFVGQQKPAYNRGDFPTPYYDARDGFPYYLLLNDGLGNFTDVTEERGLADKRLRRMFSCSFVDFDTDGDPDLLTVSDFSGADLYENDGHGYFTDVSERMDPPGYAFGMSHTFGDYNLDGHLDFLLIGMSSTTARRLEYLNLNREEFPEYNKARMLMGYGNRLYLGDGRGHFTQAPFNDSVARTGWSWGSTTLDFDNDTDPDLFVCNGQISGATTQDYCTRFWCHDVYYREGERPDKAIQEFFGKMAPLFSGFGVSWNGYEHNALLMNLGGRDFVNVGFLMGVSHEFDARACVSGDLDGDGRVDIIVEHKDLRHDLARLYFLRNELETPNNWIGFHLRSDRPDAAPLGARVALELPDGRKLMRYNVAGHSLLAQHDDSAHFGLGTAREVKRVIVTWPNGEKTELTGPEPGRYHVVTPPKR